MEGFQINDEQRKGWVSSASIPSFHVPLRVVNLRCEGLSDPIGIACRETVHVGWQIAGPARGVRQKAYWI